MTVRELMQKILLEAPNRLDSSVYFGVPRENDDIWVDSYEVIEISDNGSNDSLHFLLKKI